MKDQDTTHAPEFPNPSKPSGNNLVSVLSEHLTLFPHIKPLSSRNWRNTMYPASKHLHDVLSLRFLHQTPTERVCSPESHKTVFTWIRWSQWAAGLVWGTVTRNMFRCPWLRTLDQHVGLCHVISSKICTPFQCRMRLP